MGAPLLAYVQNIVQEVRVCVSSRMVIQNLPREPSMGPAGEGTEPTERSSEQQRREASHRGEERGATQQRVLQGEDEVGEHE